MCSPQERSERDREMRNWWSICTNASCRPVYESTGDGYCKYFEYKLKFTRAMAFINIVIFSLNSFLSYCALTWACAVVLGGLVGQLTEHDYFSVIVLLFLEAVRLAVAKFFGKFVTWRLVHGSVDPHRLIYNDAFKQQLQGAARILEQAIQLTVVTVSILVPVRRLEDLKTLSVPMPPPSSLPGSGFDGSLVISLRIFYVLVLVNGVIAGIGVIFSKNVVPFFVDSSSLRKYYEKIVWKGMDEGLFHAKDFELLSWAFEMQADEYRRNIRAPVVKDLYGDMLKYLYFHPRNKGFEAAKVALESNDTFEREAAANIVGLWTLLATEPETSKSNDTAVQQIADAKNAVAEIKNGDCTNVQIEPNNEVEMGKMCNGDMRNAEIQDVGDDTKVEKQNGGKIQSACARLVMQKKLLAKLAEALDSDETGRAASVSFHALAQKEPEAVLAVRSGGRNEKVADILMERIHEAVELRKPQKAIIDIKVMISLLPIIMMDRIAHETDGEKLTQMKEDMKKIVEEYKTYLKRVQVVAAKAYRVLTVGREDETKALHVECLQEKPKYKQHILKDEVEFLYEIMGSTDLPKQWDGAVKLKEEEGEHLPWVAWRSTALLASVVNIALLAVASHYIMRYAHF